MPTLTDREKELKEIAKAKSRQTRIREHAQDIYRSLLVAIHAKMASLPQPPTTPVVREVHNKAAAVSIDAAEIFEQNWNAFKGRFIEDKK